MTIRKLADMTDHIVPGKPLLGLDLGEKTIGVALSDVMCLIATPLTTLRRVKFTEDAMKLASMITEHDVCGLVLGWPINMDGSEGPRCQSVQQFAQNLIERMDIEIGFWDERLSTVAVTKTMLEADISRAKQKKAVDKMAAAFILQGALDFLSHIRERG